MLINVGRSTKNYIYKQLEQLTFKLCNIFQEYPVPIPCQPMTADVTSQLPVPITDFPRGVTLAPPQPEPTTPCPPFVPHLGLL